MPRIQIRYNEVYSRVAELRSRAKSKIGEMDSGYAQIQSSLDSVDSATNASLMAAMERNARKAHTVAQTLDKLLSFMNSSTQQVELEDQAHQQAFLGGGR